MITKKQLESMSAHDIIKKIDFEKYVFWQMKAGVACIETSAWEYCLTRKDEIIDAVEKMKTKEWYDCILVCIIDPKEKTNITIVAGECEEDIIHKAFRMTTDRGIADLGNRISRSQDIIPTIEESL